MSLSDAKICRIKPSDKPFKLTDSQGLYLRVNPGGSRLYISNIASTEKNPASHWVPIRRSRFPKPANSATVSMKCWRRISIPCNNRLLKKPPRHRKNALKPLRWNGTKPTKNSRLTMQSAFSPV